MSTDCLSQLAFFQGLTPAQMDVLRPIFNAANFRADMVIFEQGAPAEHLYIVVEGEVLVSFKPDDGPHMPIGRIHSGGVVGWSAALGSRKYTSAAITTQNSQLLRVRGADLRHIFRQYPEIGCILKEHLANVIAERTAGSYAQVMALLNMAFNPTDTQPEAKA